MEYHHLFYVCGDEVNRSLVSEWLAAAGWALTDDPLGAAAYLVDVDHLPLDVTARDLTRLLPSPASRPVAFHGYNLSRSRRRWLRWSGVVVWRRVKRRLLRRLLHPVGVTPRR